MSSRPRKRRVEAKEAPRKQPKDAPVRPTGRVPEAVVVARHGTGTVSRPGRGYSLGELSGSGIMPRLASTWGVRLDPRRRSVLDGNLSSLKAWSSRPGQEARAEGGLEKIEEELKKAGKKVEEEAVAAGKEVVKLEKEVKKGAEKAVKEKVEKLKKAPAKKPRPKKKGKA